MSGRGNGGTAVIVMTVAVFAVVAVWWLESRFGKEMTGYALIGLFGVLCVLVGQIINLASTRSTLQSAADFNQHTAGVEKFRQQAFKELVKGDAHERRAAAQITVLDARRVDKLAAQRAKLLTDAERERWELQQQRSARPAWADDDDGDSFSEWE